MGRPKTKIGRPPVDLAERRDKPVKAMVTAAELAEINAAAKADDRRVSEWARRVLLEAARKHNAASNSARPVE
jgi:hypothetical protein